MFVCLFSPWNCDSKCCYVKTRCQTLKTTLHNDVGVPTINRRLVDIIQSYFVLYSQVHDLIQSFRPKKYMSVLDFSLEKITYGRSDNFFLFHMGFMETVSIVCHLSVYMLNSHNKMFRVSKIAK